MYRGAYATQWPRWWGCMLGGYASGRSSHARRRSGSSPVVLVGLRFGNSRDRYGGRPVNPCRGRLVPDRGYVVYSTPKNRRHQECFSWPRPSGGAWTPRGAAKRRFGGCAWGPSADLAPTVQRGIDEHDLAPFVEARDDDRRAPMPVHWGKRENDGAPAPSVEAAHYPQHAVGFPHSYPYIQVSSRGECNFS